MKITTLLSFLILFRTLASAGDQPAYRLFDQGGKESSYGFMLEALEGADVVLFGEMHDNPICHWLQLELVMDLHLKLDSGLRLGAEMFETDMQLLLDEYMQGTIPESRFEAEARLWKNYPTDYRPVLRFAREHGLRFIATNVPRRYANLVYRKGFEGLDSLSTAAKELLPPLPVAYDPELPAYKAMLEMGGMGPNHASPKLPMAQAIKDATMAHFILINLPVEGLFLHLNGSYHSDHREGIVWYLRQQRPDLEIRTISSVWQEALTTLDESHQGKADFILVVPSTMTRTH